MRAFSSMALAFCVLLFSSTAQAFDACGDGGTGWEQMECNIKALESAEIKLNQAYKKRLSSLKPQSGEAISAQKMLMSAQRAWVRFRDEHCIFEGYAETGSAQDITAAKLKCQLKLTFDRAAWLDIQH